MKGTPGRVQAKILLLLMTLVILVGVGYGTYRWVNSALSRGNIPVQPEVPVITTAEPPGTASSSSAASSSTEQVPLSGSLRPITLTAGYLWSQDGANREMVLYTPPSYAAMDAGAILPTDIIPVWTQEDRDRDGQTDVPEMQSCVAATLIPLYLLPGDTIVLPSIRGFSFNYFECTLDNAANRYRCQNTGGWQDLNAATLRAETACWVILNFAWSNLDTEDPTDIDHSRPLTEEEARALAKTLSLYHTHPEEAYRSPVLESASLASEVTTTRGTTADGAGYVLVRIPATLSNGSKVTPHVDTTNSILEDAYVDQMELKDYNDPRLTRSALPVELYSQVYHTGITINAGLFLLENYSPLGLTVSDGTVITSTGLNGATAGKAGEYYALTIDTLGHLSYSQKEDGTPDSGYIAFSLVQAGRNNVITGWGCLVYNGRSVVTTDEDNTDPSMLFYDTQDTRHSRQVIGQDGEGNYWILSTTEAVSGTGYGLTYQEVADILIRAGLKFAFALDGGLSVSTVIDGNRITPLYEGTYGRPVPTVITFRAE